MTVEATAITANNFSLEDHWNQGNARAAVAKGSWSFVVLQQGPSALPESSVLLREYARRFAGEARKTGARTALYMVWPAKAQIAGLRRASANRTRSRRATSMEC